MRERGDLYAVLGVPSEATQEEIRRAFRALVRRHHPDTRCADDNPPAGATSPSRTGGVERDEALQRALAAYAVLGDPQARADYDRAVRGRVGHTVEVRRSDPPPRAGGDEPPPIRVGPVRWQPFPR